MDQQSGQKRDRGDLAEQILARLAGDAEFRQQILANPAETLRQEGYDTGDDVEGYIEKGIAITTSIGCGVPPDAALSDGKDPVVGTTAMGCGGGGVGVPGSDPYEGSPTMSSPSTSSTPPSVKKDSTTH